MIVVDANTLLKARKMPVGTVSKGHKKVAEGKWVTVKQDTPSGSTGETASIEKKVNKQYDELSRNLGFDGGKIKWKEVTKQMASKALNNSKGMSKAYYDRLRGIESGGKSLRKKIRKSITISSPSELAKSMHKYIRKYRKNNRWEYVYEENKGRRHKTGDKPEGKTLRGVTRAEEIRVLKQFRKRAPGDGIEKTIQTKSDLNVLLTRSTFAIMSAGRNPANAEDMKLSDLQIKARHAKLIARLKAEGFVYTQCKGKYENPEESVMVMAHDSDRETAMAIGAAFNQDSIVFCSRGKNEIIYTTGEKKGKAGMAGEGYEEVPDAEDYYTKMPLATGDTFKFSLSVADVAKSIHRMFMRLFKSRSPK